MELAMIKLKAHQNNQSNENDGFPKFIGHEDYNPNHHWKMKSSSNLISSWKEMKPLIGRKDFFMTLALGISPRQRYGKVQVGSATRECRRVWGNEPTHSQVDSHFGSWSLDGFPNLQRTIGRVKSHWIENFFISLESS